MELFFDTETTGLPKYKLPIDDPAQPMIVQLAAIMSDADKTPYSIRIQNVDVGTTCDGGMSPFIKTPPDECHDPPTPGVQGNFNRSVQY